MREIALECWRSAVAGKRPEELLVRLWMEMATEPTFAEVRTQAQRRSLCRDLPGWTDAASAMSQALRERREHPPHDCPLLLAATLDAALAEDGHHHPRIVTIDTPTPSTWFVHRRQGAVPHARQHKRSHWFCHHSIVPAHHDGRRILLVTAPAATMQQLRRLAERGSVDACVATFARGDGVDFDQERWARGLFRAERLRDHDERWSELVEALDRCRAGVDLLVFPELQIDVALRERVADWLRREEHGMTAVLAGSFHEDTATGRRNRAVLLGARGNVLLEHDKFTQYTFASDASDRPPGVDRHSEDVDLGKDLTLLWSDLGTLALAVCLDYCDETACVHAVWDTVSPDLVLVAALNVRPDAGAFRRAAERIRRTCGARTVVANQPYQGGSVWRATFCPGADLAEPLVKTSLALEHSGEA